MSDLDFPEGIDETNLQTKFDELALATAKRIREFFVKALMAIAIIGLSSAIALFGFGIVLRELNSTDNQIQNQRFNTLYDICVDQNERHNKAIGEAKKILPMRAHDTVFRLVDQLVPYIEDCFEYTRDRVKGGG